MLSNSVIFAQKFYNSQSKPKERKVTIAYIHTPMHGSTNGLFVSYEKIGGYFNTGYTFEETKGNRYWEAGISYEIDNKLFLMSGVGKYDVQFEEGVLRDTWSLNGGLMYNLLPKNKFLFAAPFIHMSPVGFKIIGVVGVNF